MSPSVRFHALAVVTLLCTSCAIAARHEPGWLPPYKSGKPVQVGASVEQFRHRGACIDFDQDFVAYDSIVLTVSKPNRYA